MPYDPHYALAIQSYNQQQAANFYGQCYPGPSLPMEEKKKEKPKINKKLLLLED